MVVANLKAEIESSSSQKEGVKAAASRHMQQHRDTLVHSAIDEAIALLKEVGILTIVVVVVVAVVIVALVAVLVAVVIVVIL